MKISKKEVFVGILLIFILSFFCINTVSANGIKVTAKPSASSNLPYTDHTLVWDNYCPMCGNHDVLEFNPKKTHEGELTCSKCGADYCAVTGKEKDGKISRANLSLFKGNHVINYAAENEIYQNDNSISFLETILLDKLSINLIHKLI